MSILKLLIFSMFIFSQLTFAKEIFFVFDINSSGPEIYPCNAGIAHHKQKPWCHIKGTTLPCVPDFIPDSQVRRRTGPNPPCICTGTDGSSILDFLRFTASKWDGAKWDDEFILGTVTGKPDGSIPNVVQKLHGVNNIENEFQTQIEQLSINLSSERYGAEYFVDFCYRGPQIEYFVSNESYWNQRAPFYLHSFMTITSLVRSDSSKKSYIELAKPWYATEIVCDLQGEGEYKYAHNSLISPYDRSAHYDTFLTDLYELYRKSNGYLLDAQNFIMGMKDIKHSFGTRDDEIRFKVLKNWKPFSENTHMYYNFMHDFTPINRHTSHTPRFCKLRYYFRESLFGERAWQRHDARVAIKVNIEERD